jgi:hypothetical protein
VERAVLETLLGELKLGTSKLADRNVALSLGKLLAARFILTGKITHSGPYTQVSLRLIETETGRIPAVVNEAFGAAVPASELSEKLSRVLLEKLQKLYPLRGIISEIKADKITLNIGQETGVTPGQRFKVVDEEITLEVVSALPDTSLVKVEKAGTPVDIGQRVEAVELQSTDSR